MANPKKRIYISGKITGDDNYRTKFAKAEKRLIRDGYAVLNPAEFSKGMEKKAKELGVTLEWGDYMRKCLVTIPAADAMYMLRDWQESRGARLEHHIASELGIKIVYEEEASEERASCDNSSIVKLHYLLKGSGIPHTLIDRAERGWQIVYPDANASTPTVDTVASVIQGPYSYGGDRDLLELKGLLTPEERYLDEVAGGLTAADVFGRILAHWTASAGEGGA